MTAHIIAEPERLKFPILAYKLVHLQTRASEFQPCHRGLQGQRHVAIPATKWGQNELSPWGNGSWPTEGEVYHYSKGATIRSPIPETPGIYGFLCVDDVNHYIRRRATYGGLTEILTMITLRIPKGAIVMRGRLYFAGIPCIMTDEVLVVT